MPQITRADLPAEFTPDTLRRLPFGALRQLARPDNGILTEPEQAAYDRALHELMAEMAQRVHAQVEQSSHDEGRHGPGSRRRPNAPAQDSRREHRSAGKPSREERNLERVARRLELQLDAMGKLSPDVAWPSLPAGSATARTQATATEPAADIDVATEHQTVDDLTQEITDQVELVEVMTQVVEVSQRTYDLEQQREASNTRGVFFGLLVSVAVIISGWAPLVEATWHQRVWILGLTLVTCAVAGLVYAVVRRSQTRQTADV